MHNFMLTCSSRWSRTTTFVDMFLATSRNARLAKLLLYTSAVDWKERENLNGANHDTDSDSDPQSKPLELCSQYFDQYGSFVTCYADLYEAVDRLSDEDQRRYLVHIMREARESRPASGAPLVSP